jgi:hypothetical protein
MASSPSIKLRKMDFLEEALKIDCRAAGSILAGGSRDSDAPHYRHLDTSNYSKIGQQFFVTQNMVCHISFLICISD